MPSILPKYLQIGDKVAIVGTGKHFDKEVIFNAKQHFESWGLKVMLGEGLFDYNGAYFSTSLENRVKDLQNALNDSDCRAIFFARGGYGLLQMLDRLDFTNFVKNPKWLIGYSDITAIQNHVLARYNIASIHGEMPLNYPIFPHTDKNLESLRENLFNASSLTATTTTLIGGNLSLLTALLGSESLPDSDGKILFIEDVGESYYRIDRMLWSLRRAGYFDKLVGVMLGMFTNCSDCHPPFGESLDEILQKHFIELHIPIYQISAGHCSDNTSFVFGLPLRQDVRPNCPAGNRML
ncbi:peptidase S66 [Bacteroidia bacterium]|nr:peptidase S66 [Bacteroidia bacterium]